MERRSFLRGLLAACAAPVTAATALSRGTPVRDVIPMLDIKLEMKEIRVVNRKLRAKWVVEYSEPVVDLNGFDDVVRKKLVHYTEREINGSYYSAGVIKA